MTFIVEGQRPVSLPVSVRVISYVTIEPQTIDPTKQPDGRMTIRATDGQPFRIVSMSPRLVEGLDDADEAVQHVVNLDWDKWKELGQNRRLVFNLDHPEIDQVSALVRYRAPSAAARQPFCSYPMTTRLTRGLCGPKATRVWGSPSPGTARSSPPERLPWPAPSPSLLPTAP